MRRHTIKLAVGLLLVVLCAPPPTRSAESPRPAPVLVPDAPPIQWTVLEQAITDQARWYEQAASQPAPVTLPRKTPTRSHRGYGSARECVAAVENHGDYARSSNASHFGRYQFSRSTWAAYGGNPDTWGSAAAAEQDKVFDRAWKSSGGPSNWLPYDGC